MNIVSPTRAELFSGVVYLVVMVFCFWASLHYLGVENRLSAAWIVAAVVGSQIFLDLGRFSSPESKARISASFRTVGAVFALAYAYLF